MKRKFARPIAPAIPLGSADSRHISVGVKSGGEPTAIRAAAHS
jgi:hypothetical protein